MVETRRKFDEDVRQGAIRLVRESHCPIVEVARELGVNVGTLGNWVNADQRRRENGRGPISEDERAELVRLRKENVELRMQRDVLKRSVVGWVDEAMAGSGRRWTTSSSSPGSPPWISNCAGSGTSAPKQAPVPA